MAFRSFGFWFFGFVSDFAFQISDLSFPVDLTVVFALGIEAGCFLDTLSRVRVTRGDGFVARQGLRGERSVVLVESGVGAQHAAKATHALIDAYRPRRVVSAGFAGGLDARLRREDLVAVTSVRNSQGDEILLDPAGLIPWLGEVRGLHQGRLLTSDCIVRLREEKQELGRRHEALAVDMETFAVAEVCRGRGVELLAIRAISDAAGDELPADVGKLLVQKSFAGQLGAALGSIFRRPGAVKDLFHLHQAALAASSRLAGFLGMLIERR
jgi:adenosylhomocysteine nucleosidase